MLKIVKAQGQGLVSDEGRWGYQHEGVPVGGVLDGFSHAIGNRALGNPDNSACLELMGRFDFVCTKPCQVFIANRGANARLNHAAVHCGRVLQLQEGDVLRIEPPGLGVWNMLCVQGGVNVPLVMDSRSTCVAAAFGGMQGRALQVGDEIHCGTLFEKSLPTHCRLAMPLAPRNSAGDITIHCLEGPEFHHLTPQSQGSFLSRPCSLSTQSSRMGYRFEASPEALVLQQPLSMLSHAVHPGIVQLPPGGHPVVLLSECQVTGGYPRIASVLSCDLWRFAQLASGQRVHWVIVDVEQAGRLQHHHDLELMRYFHVIETSGGQSDVD